jgi:hypothetical protein
MQPLVWRVSILSSFIEGEGQGVRALALLDRGNAAWGVDVVFPRRTEFDARGGIRRAENWNGRALP